MLDSRDEIVDRLRKRLNHGMRIIRVEDGLIFEHRNATHFLAEIDLQGGKITVPVTADFRDHPDYTEDEIVEHAMEVLRPRLRLYRDRGYRIRETDWQPGYRSATYDGTKIPVFIAFVEKDLDGREQLYAELAWLLEQLPDR